MAPTYYNAEQFATYLREAGLKYGNRQSIVVLMGRGVVKAQAKDAFGNPLFTERYVSEFADRLRAESGDSA